MTRSELIAEIARKQGIAAGDVEKVLDSIVQEIEEKLKAGESVTIAGFGRFEMRERKSKAYTNPKTKAKSQLAPTSIPGFKASGLFKKSLSS